MRTPGKAICLISASFVIASFIACFRDGGEAPPSERERQLFDLVEIVILPTYRSFLQSATALNQSSRDHCASPTGESLSLAQAQWKSARLIWKHSEAFQFGPVATLRIKTAVDFWPIRKAEVEALLDGTQPVNDDTIAGLGTTFRGLPVIEWLLFERMPKEKYPPSTGQLTSRTCQYLVALTADVERQAQNLLEAWDEEEGGFGAQFKRAGKDGTPYMRQQGAFDEIVNQLIAAAQAIEDSKLAKPLGKRDGGVPQPDAVESAFSGQSSQDLQAALDGIADVYYCRFSGQKGYSIARLVALANPTIDQEVKAQIERTRTAVAAIPAPLSASVSNNPEAVENAYQEAKRLSRLLAADVAGALAVTTTFSDNDGD